MAYSIVEDLRHSFANLSLAQALVENLDPTAQFVTPIKEDAPRTAQKLSDEELDAALRPLYYATFPGTRALWEELPAGAASLRRVRDWVNLQHIGEAPS